MFNKYVSLSIPCNDSFKNIVAKYNQDEIEVLEGITELEHIGKIKKFNFNCRYVVLIPAEDLLYRSLAIQPKNDFKISEQQIFSQLNQNGIEFENEYYYDYLDNNPQSDQKSKEIKLFAAEKEQLDPLTAVLDKNRNNYLVSALPVVIYSVINGLRDEANFLLYYKFGGDYTVLLVENNYLELVRSSIKKSELKEELEKIKKYYLNVKKSKLSLLEGSSELLDLDNFVNLKEDDFVFLSSLLWCVSRC
ncbi:hypothetical protein LJ207_00240 [Halanaerobium sp. Z-7514]|uniref:Uncharacterized protein n=1 Tax=Halanaerobium polyolivorans TaxID=2886943 RepID=A0AAW4WYL7_9FIRM|nr:hypothetical protein [Halanaerobium polyolivorans]MCC3143754.1 hypothetical protein [Halanaerobium polyolivorans]RQD73852.1 MAG: hypothetical protein D5S01_07385 [Halanaerobium sp. MSAO_Bac5]